MVNLVNVLVEGTVVQKSAKNTYILGLIQKLPSIIINNVFMCFLIHSCLL
jgi:hypothetical protein